MRGFNRTQVNHVETVFLEERLERGRSVVVQMIGLAQAVGEATHQQICPPAEIWKREQQSSGRAQHRPESAQHLVGTREVFEDMKQSDGVEGPVGKQTRPDEFAHRVEAMPASRFRHERRGQLEKRYVPADLAADGAEFTGRPAYLQQSDFVWKIGACPVAALAGNRHQLIANGAPVRQVSLAVTGLRLVELREAGRRLKAETTVAAAEHVQRPLVDENA